jgi:hypothetical protein
MGEMTTKNLYEMLEGLVDVLVDKGIITDEEYEVAAIKRLEGGQKLTRFEELKG